MTTQVDPIPKVVKWGFSIWMLFWITVVLMNQGPQNFFWLCNIAQFITLYALWRGDRLLMSSQVGVVTVVGIGWSLDVLVGLASGDSVTGMTAYMFNEERPLIVRLISLYHVFLPILLITMIRRVGYDRRGPWLQCAIGALAVIGSWLFTDPERNINWMFHVFGTEQVWMPEPLWALVLIVVYPLVLYFPGHWLIVRFFDNGRWPRKAAPSQTGPP